MFENSISEHSEVTHGYFKERDIARRGADLSALRQIQDRLSESFAAVAAQARDRLHERAHPLRSAARHNALPRYGGHIPPSGRAVRHGDRACRAARGRNTVHGLLRQHPGGGFPPRRAGHPARRGRADGADTALPRHARRASSAGLCGQRAREAVRAYTQPRQRQARLRDDALHGGNVLL